MLIERANQRQPWNATSVDPLGRNQGRAKTTPLENQKKYRSNKWATSSVQRGFMAFTRLRFQRFVKYFLSLIFTPNTENGAVFYLFISLRYPPEFDWFFFVSVFHVIWTSLKNLNVQSRNRFQISTVGGFFWNFILLLSLSYFYWSQVFLITGNKPPFYSLPTEKIRSTRFLLIKLILTEEKIIKHKRNYSWIFFFLFCFKWGKTEKKEREKKRNSMAPFTVGPDPVGCPSGSWYISETFI